MKFYSLSRHLKFALFVLLIVANVQLGHAQFVIHPKSSAAQVTPKMRGSSFLMQTPRDGLLPGEMWQSLTRSPAIRTSRALCVVKRSIVTTSINWKQIASPREFILFVTDGSISHRFRKAVRAVTISEHWEKIAEPREETKRPLMESEKCWT